MVPNLLVAGGPEHGLNLSNWCNKGSDFGFAISCYHTVGAGISGEITFFTRMQFSAITPTSIADENFSQLKG